MSEMAKRPRWFYFGLALTALAVAVAGFTPTYFMPLATGKAMPPLLHLHAFFLFSWALLFCWQTWLVASGRTPRHREWGMLGIAIATAIPFTVMALVSVRTYHAAASGDPALINASYAFAWVQVSGMLFFAPCVALAIANVKRPETHKRLMTLAAISLLGAPIARFFIVFLAPPGAAGGGVPPVEVAMIPSLIGDLWLVAAIVHDMRTRKSVHPAYVIGGAIMLGLQATLAIVAHSQWWMSLAPLLGKLGG